MKLKCYHADTCLPDYWPGHHLPHVQVPVYKKKMSIAAIRREILSEVSRGAIAGNGDLVKRMDNATGDEWEQIYKAVKAAVNRDIRGARKGQRYINTGVNVSEDDDATAYMFFVFREA